MILWQDDDLVRDQRVEFHCYRQLSIDYKPHDLIFVDDLLECAQIEPVKYPLEGEANTRSIMNVSQADNESDRSYQKVCDAKSGPEERISRYVRTQSLARWQSVR